MRTDQARGAMLLSSFSAKLKSVLDSLPVPKPQTVNCPSCSKDLGGKLTCPHCGYDTTLVKEGTAITSTTKR